MSIFIRAKQTSEILGIGKSTVWRWAASGILPKPTKLSGGVSVWKKSEIIAFAESKRCQ